MRQAGREYSRSDSGTFHLQPGHRSSRLTVRLSGAIGPIRRRSITGRPGTYEAIVRAATDLCWIGSDLALRDVTDLRCHLRDVLIDAPDRRHDGQRWCPPFIEKENPWVLIERRGLVIVRQQYAIDFSTKADNSHVFAKQRARLVEIAVLDGNTATGRNCTWQPTRRQRFLGPQ
jgi:hypothetical protein